MNAQQYAAPVSPWALNASQLDSLRAQVEEAEVTVAKTKDWTERTRLDQNAKALRRELQSAELEVKLCRHRAQHNKRTTCEAVGLTRSDGGDAFVSNIGEPRFMATVPYWKADQRLEQMVSNADPSSSACDSK